MGKLALSLLFLISVNLYAGEYSQSKSTEDIDTSIAYLQETDDSEFDTYLDSESSLRLEKIDRYNNMLNLFLSESNDIKIQLSAFKNSYEAGFKLNEMKSVLKTAITSSSDKHTLFLADSLCHNNKKLTQWCHQQQIHKIHREIDPENIFTYLFALSETDNKDKIQEILDEAADKSTYSDSFFFEYVLEQAQQIELFNNEYPLVFNQHSAMAALDNIDYMQEIEKSISSQRLVEKGIVPSDFMQNLVENTSIISAIGIEMASISSFGKIIQTCQKSNNTESCLYIGKLLMNDKVLINQMQGSSIITEMQKQLTKDEESIQESRTIIDKLTQEQMCYVQINDVMYAMMSNKKFMTQYIIDAKNNGELAATKKLAYAVYNIEKRNGFNPGFNPKDCQ